LSGIITGNDDTANNAYNQLRLYQYYPDATVASGKMMEVKEIIAINLTQGFGMGNEPTLEEINKYYTKWFVGTKNLGSQMSVVLRDNIKSINENMRKTVDEQRKEILSAKTPKIITLFDAQDLNAVTPAGALDTVANDFTNYKMGNKGIKVNVLGADGHQVTLEPKGNPVNLDT